ncbi:MAG: hypothetical protein LBP92_02625 [Deltaproteobacteria bacterium]|nr:hypothetical protein [Deltaproteobacteria bacterium]
MEKELKAVYPKDHAHGFTREAFRALNWSHLTSPTSPLKNLAAYLKDELPEYDLKAIKWDQAYRLVLEVFHGPFDDDVNPLYRQAMDAYIHDRVYFEPLVDIRQLALAEAWLAALKRDRRRKGDGEKLIPIMPLTECGTSVII